MQYRIYNTEQTSSESKRMMIHSERGNMVNMKKRISFVIPCYRSENTITGVLDEIRSVMKDSETYDYEIVAVNDSSPDRVYEVLTVEQKKDDRITVIDLAKNAGKQSAVMAGFSMVSGEIVVCLDDDGQCPVQELWKLVDGIEHGYDAVMAQYGRKKQSVFRNMGSRMNSVMFHWLLDKPKNLQLSNFYAIKIFIVREMMQYRNPYPYLHGLMLRATQNILGVPMEERRRQIGKSGYTLRKLVAFWLDGLTGFSVKPLRVAIALGMCSSFGGIIYGIYLLFRRIRNVTVVTGWTSLMALMLFLGGVILVVLGLIGEYIGRIYICMNASPQYVIRHVEKNRYLKGNENDV